MEELHLQLLRHQTTNSRWIECENKSKNCQINNDTFIVIFIYRNVIQKTSAKERWSIGKIECSCDRKEYCRKGNFKGSKIKILIEEIEGKKKERQELPVLKIPQLTRKFSTFTWCVLLSAVDSFPLVKPRAGLASGSLHATFALETNHKLWPIAPVFVENQVLWCFLLLFDFPLQRRLLLSQDSSLFHHRQTLFCL